MANVIFYKQKPTKVSQYFGIDALERSVYPGARQTKTPKVESDRRTWVTGLNENSVRVNGLKDQAKRKAERDRIVKTRKELEELMGVDLSPHSSYWDEYELVLCERDKAERIVNLDKPEDRLFHIVAQENRFVAPSYDDLYLPEYEDTMYYIFNPKQDVTRKVLLQELKDEVGTLFATHKNNTDKLFYWAAALDKSVHRSMGREDLYSMLMNHRETLNSIESYEKFLDVLKRSNQELQLGYLVRKGVRNRVITKDGGQYVLSGQPLGVTETEVINNLQLAEYTYLVDSLQKLDQ